jgi:hypothetical protein
MKAEAIARTYDAYCLSLAVVLAAAGCRAPSGPATNTAEVAVGGDDHTVRLESCGRDGAMIFLVGEGNGVVLQVAIEVEGERGEETAETSGAGVSVVFEEDDRAVGAFGADAAERAGVPGDPPGTIESVRIDGSRVRISAQAEVLDRDNRGTGEAAGRLTVDANCPEPVSSEAESSRLRQ